VGSVYASLIQTNSAARGLLTALYFVWVASEMWIRVSRPRPTGQTQQLSGRGTGPLILVTILGALIAASALASKNVGPQILAQSWLLFGLGVAVALIGIAVRVWAVVTLGQFFQLFVVVQEGHRVVRNGPYRVIRHPSYLGALMTIVGIGIALDNWLSLVVCVVVPLAGLLPRIFAEERALEVGLGEDYRDYQRHTSRLVPGLW
jgi:protein-S-isoprenylcysteine O-methyltransferase Ste14